MVPELDLLRSIMEHMFLGEGDQGFVVRLGHPVSASVSLNSHIICERQIPSQVAVVAAMIFTLAA